jgi:hypothetical protein
MRDDADVRRLLESAAVEPTDAEREAILAAAEPILADHARRAKQARERERRLRPRFRWGDLFGIRRVAFAAAAVVVLGVVILARRPETREPRSAPLQSWAEHLKSDPGSPFPLASASFGRPY